MKIALINENSQNSKNPMIEAAFKMAVESMSHTVLTIPKNTLQLAALASKCAKCPTNGCRGALGCLGLT